MKAHPIIVSAPMVKALLESRKTQTRRLVKTSEKLPHSPESFQHNGWAFFKEYAGGVCSRPFRCTYGGPGDLLWVKETFSPSVERENHAYARDGFSYRADWDMHDDIEQRDFRWKPSIFMPRRVSRLTLELTEVRVERLNSISEEDAKAEGAQCLDLASGREAVLGDGSYTAQYRNIWVTINGYGSWDANPWVWVLEFRVHKINVDAMLAKAA